LFFSRPTTWKIAKIKKKLLFLFLPPTADFLGKSSQLDRNNVFLVHKQHGNKVHDNKMLFWNKKMSSSDIESFTGIFENSWKLKKIFFFPTSSWKPAKQGIITNNGLREHVLVVTLIRKSFIRFGGINIDKRDCCLGGDFCRLSTPMTSERSKLSGHKSFQRRVYQNHYNIILLKSVDMISYFKLTIKQSHSYCRQSWPLPGIWLKCYSNDKVDF
jgi:hypothetical protein